MNFSREILSADDMAWLDYEEHLYQKLMDQPFPGESELSKAQDLECSRKAIDRCWKAIRLAAEDANPDYIVRLTINHMNHPHVLNSDMYKEADWLMNESGDIGRQVNDRQKEPPHHLSGTLEQATCHKGRAGSPSGWHQPLRIRQATRV